MRELTLSELNAISGGEVNYFDSDLMAKVKAKVIRDGAIDAIVVSVLAAAIVLGFSDNYIVTASAVVMLAPCAGIYGILNSSAWTNPVV